MTPATTAAFNSPRLPSSIRRIDIMLDHRPSIDCLSRHALLGPGGPRRVWFAAGSSDQPLDIGVRQRRLAGLSGTFMQKSVNARLGKMPLPAPPERRLTPEGLANSAAFDRSEECSMIRARIKGVQPSQPAQRSGRPFPAVALRELALIGPQPVVSGTMTRRES